MPPTSRQCGFTLIETLTVLFILALVIGFAFAKMPDKQPAAVRAVTHELAGSLMAAQNLARNSGRRVYLRTYGGGSATCVLEWGFTDPNNPTVPDPSASIQGSWSEDTRTFALAPVGGLLPLANPGPSSVSAIKDYVNNQWSGTLFDGADSIKAYCETNGSFSSNCVAAVYGRNSILAPLLGTCPMGLVVAGQRTGVGAFYKPVANDSGTPWQRM